MRAIKSFQFAALAAACLLLSPAAAEPITPSQSTQTFQPVQVAPSTAAAPADQPVPPSQPAQAAQSTPTTPAAQPPKPPRQVLYGNPCRADLEKFCVSSQPTVIRMKCLDAHEAEFSGACQRRRAELRELRSACQTVIKQSCPYVPLVPNAILQCLQDHEAELVDQCQRLREKARQPKRYIAAACQADFKKFCKDVPLNDFQIAQCLQEHAAELSEPCRTGAPEK